MGPTLTAYSEQTLGAVSVTVILSVTIQKSRLWYEQYGEPSSVMWNEFLPKYLSLMLFGALSTVNLNQRLVGKMRQNGSSAGVNNRVGPDLRTFGQRS